MTSPAPSKFTVNAAASAVEKLTRPDGSEPPEFILGSQSASRKVILKAAGASFSTMPPNIDEKAIGDRLTDDPRQLVQAIATAKADALVKMMAAKDPSGLTQGLGLVLLTSDQVVTYEGAIREKPADAAEARRFVDSYSSAPCGTVSGCAIIPPSSRACHHSAPTCF